MSQSQVSSSSNNEEKLREAQELENRYLNQSPNQQNLQNNWNKIPNQHISLNELYRQVANDITNLQGKHNKLEKNIQNKKNRKKEFPTGTGKKAKDTRKKLEKKIKKGGVTLGKIKQEKKSKETILEILNREKHMHKPIRSNSSNIQNQNQQRVQNQGNNNRQSVTSQQINYNVFNNNNKSFNINYFPKKSNTPNTPIAIEYNNPNYGGFVNHKGKTVDWSISLWAQKEGRPGRLSKVEYETKIDPIIKQLKINIDKNKKKENEPTYAHKIRTALHYHKNPQGRHRATAKNSWTLETKTKRNKAPHTLNNIKEVLLNLQKKVQNKKNAEKLRNQTKQRKLENNTKRMEENKVKSTFPPLVRVEWKTNANGFKIYTNIGNTTPTKSNAHERKSIFTFPKNQSTSVEIKNLHNRFSVMNRRTNINTSMYKIQPSIFKTREPVKLILNKIYAKLKPILAERKDIIYNETNATDRKMLSDYIYHFIHQQTVQIHPKGLTGEMIDIVIDNPEDLCNFFLMQKLDIQHDFGKGSRGKKDKKNEQNNKNITNREKELIKQGVDRIKNFVNEQTVRQFINALRSNVQELNPGKDVPGIFNQVFTEENIKKCYVAKNLRGLDEQGIFDKLTRGKHNSNTPSSSRNVINNPPIQTIQTMKEFRTEDVLKGHRDLVAIFDAASMREIKETTRKFKNYIDLTVMADAGQSLRDSFYHILVDGYHNYVDSLRKTQGNSSITSGWSYVERNLFGKPDNEFKEFYTKYIEQKLPKLDPMYTAHQFVEFVKKVETDDTVDVINILGNIINKDEYYEEFMILQNSQHESRFIFNFTTIGFRLFYKPPNSPDVILMNEAIITANHTRNSDKIASSKVNGQTDLPIGSSVNATGRFIITNNIENENIYKYLLSKTYGDFLLILRGLSKDIKYITHDRMAASIYMMFGDIMKRNPTRVLHYTKDKTYIEKIEPRIQLITESPDKGKKLTYYDSEKEPERGWVNIQGPQRGVRRRYKK